MLKKDHKVIINNRSTKELGTVRRAFRRKDVWYYDIFVERGILFERLTSDSSYPVYVELELSLKMNQNKLSKI